MAGMYKISSVSDEDEPLIGDPRSPRKPSSSKAVYRKVALVMLTAAASMLLFVLLLGFSRATKSKSDGVTTVTPPIRLPDNIKQSWAQYSPYFSVSEYAEPPDRCKITQVNIIQRHGARFPTSSAGLKIQSAVAKLQTVSHYMNPHFSFLKNYIYDLGHEDLVPFGAAQSYDSGQLDYSRYSDLVNKTNLPFVRASSSKRVVQSATNWTAGFAHASNGKAVPSLDLILRESLNDTLDDSMCPNAGDSDKYTDAWQSVYATPIAARLNAAAPDANLTVDDVSSLISLCPFDTLAKETPSAFCSLFNQSDFYGFEYLGDLSKYYGTGYGQALGPVQGVGYVNELLARLTDSPVRDNTQTNRTLDGDPATFPLGRGVYADFSHDNQMIAIYSALGLFRQPSALDPEQPDARRTWLASQLVPFSARLVTERLECGEGTFVRMLVDDALQNLEFCGAGKNGLCSLDAFVASQGYAASDGGGDFEKCFS